MTNESQISRVTRTRQQARDAYDRLSSWYDLLAASSEQPLARIGLQNLAPAADETILEIGYGTGHGLLALAQVVGAEGTVHGIDISHGMARFARTRLSLAELQSRVLLAQGDAALLPYANDRFDAVFMSFTLELFDTPEIPLVLSECWRVLKPAGRIGVVAMSHPDHPNLLVRIYEWFHTQFPAAVDCRPIRVRESITGAGFQIADVATRLMWGLPVEICMACKPPGA